jgi:hypothetical protein
LFWRSPLRAKQLWVGFYGDFLPVSNWRGMLSKIALRTAKPILRQQNSFYLSKIFKKIALQDFAATPRKLAW